MLGEKKPPLFPPWCRSNLWISRHGSGLFQRGCCLLKVPWKTRKIVDLSKLKFHKLSKLTDRQIWKTQDWKRQLDEKSKLFFCRFLCTDAPSDRASYGRYSRHDVMKLNLYVSCSNDYCADPNKIIFQVWKESQSLCVLTRIGSQLHEKILQI